jgi:hypothetical protein
MRAITLGLIAAMLCAGWPAKAADECGPGESLFDISRDIPPGTAAVWMTPVGHELRGRICFYELGHPETKACWGGGGPGSGPAPRLLLHGEGLVCGPEFLQGFQIWRTQSGA